MPGQRATSEGTSRYASRFPGIAANFRPMLEWTASSIGIGTYLGEPDAETDRAYTEAVKAAVSGGINLIDAAVNYRLQRSERSIGAAIADATSSGKVARDELI